MNPLDQLADITTPPSVSAWPLAWGYWLLIAIFVAVLILAAFSILKRTRTRQHKREALAQLNKIDAQAPYFAHKVQVIIKTIVAHYLPHAASQTMYGGQWQLLLLSVYKGKQATELTLAITRLQDDLYTNNTQAPTDKTQSNSDNQQPTHPNNQILVAMKDFVKTSFPCKKADILSLTLAKTPSLQQRTKHV